MSNNIGPVDCFFFGKAVCDLVVVPINLPKSNMNIMVSFVAEDVIVKPQEQIRDRWFCAASGMPIIRLDSM